MGELIININETIPELGGDINVYNAHIFYKRLEELINNLPADTRLFLDHDNLKGDTSWLASLAEIFSLIKKRNGILNNTKIGSVLKGVLKLYHCDKCGKNFNISFTDQTN